MASGNPQSEAEHTRPLVGRERELHAALAAHADGGGVVLTGGRRVGKTRLAREVLARLGREEGEWVTATRAASAIEFGAVSHLLPAQVTPANHRLTILRQLTDHFRAIRDRGDRAVVAIDDAHLLDHASAAFVHHLAIHGLASLILTVRAGEPAPDAVAFLWKEGLVGRVEVRALPESAAAHLLDGPSGDRHDPARGGAATRPAAPPSRPRNRGGGAPS